MFESSLELREAFEKLFERSTKLALVTNEMFPTTRRVEDDVPFTEMEGVEHLGQYVYQMTQAKAQALKEGREILPPPAVTDDNAEDSDEERDHDGATGGVVNGDDEDEEMPEQSEPRARKKPRT